jgi:hypothetical protein
MRRAGGMKCVLIIVWAGVLSGCTTQWAHPVKGDLAFEHDYAFCEAVGGKAASGMMSDKYWLMFVDVARALTARRVLEHCMERRGWTMVSSPNPDLQPHGDGVGYEK